MNDMSHGRGGLSPYAVCLSGGLRHFWPLRHNFEAALVRPNEADVFAHVYVEPDQADHATALAWLQSAPWMVRMHAEVYTASLADRIASQFPNFAILNASHASADKLASMWRKVKLANDLRKQHELARGFPYRAIVRTRPDIAYGTIVSLQRPLLKHELITPLPPHVMCGRQTLVFASFRPSCSPLLSSTSVRIPAETEEWCGVAHLPLLGWQQCYDVREVAHNCLHRVAAAT